MGEIWVETFKWVDEEGKSVLCVLVGGGGVGGWPPSQGIDALFGDNILMTQTHWLWKMAI